MEFDRNKHVYTSPDFEEIVKDTIRFFNGTPVQKLPPSEKFHGTGVYALYHIGKRGIYKDFHEINRTSYDLPIYIGKAVPKGWRQARSQTDNLSYELNTRLSQHAKSIKEGKGLYLKDFSCRFMILENQESDLIGTVEAALIRKYRPIWNTVVDGYGNHDPGKGRYQQARSDWDICHPGRPWAEKCLGVSNKRSAILSRITEYFNNLT